MAHRDPIEIHILQRDRALLGTVHGLADLFAVADRIAQEHSGAASAMLRVVHVYGGGAGGAPAVIIVPPRMTIALGMEADPAAAAWLRARHAAGATIASICGGAFLLAEAGLLEGRTITTHWACADALRAATRQSMSMPTGWQSMMATSSPRGA